MGRLLDEELSLGVPEHTCTHTRTIVFSGPAWAVGIVMTILRRQSPWWPLVLIQPDFSAERSSFLATNCAPTYGKREIPCLGEPEQSRFYSYLRKPLGTLHIEEAELVVLHGALGVSAQVAALQVPRILAACRQLCLPSSSTVTAVPSGSGELAAQLTRLEQGPAHRRAPAASPVAAGAPLASLNQPPQSFQGTSPNTTAELTHRQK